jgi:hypothetical protein
MPHGEAEDRASLEETLAVLSDPELMAAIREADAELAAGGAVRLSKQKALAELKVDRPNAPRRRLGGWGGP